MIRQLELVAWASCAFVGCLMVGYIVGGSCGALIAALGGLLTASIMGDI